MNSFISDRSFSQKQDNPSQLPRFQKAEDCQAPHQSKSPFVQNSNKKLFKIDSQTELYYNIVSSQGSMIRAAPNPTNLNSSIRVSKDEDYKHQEVQSNLNIQSQNSDYERSNIHEPSSAKDGKDQLSSHERFLNDKIARYKEEIENLIQSDFGSFNLYRNHFQVNERHLQCQEKISDLHNKYGFVLSKQYKCEEAIQKFQEASRIRQQVRDNYHAWEERLNMQGIELHARKKYENAQKNESYLTLIYGNWGWALTRLKKLDLAIEKYNEAIKIDLKVMDICETRSYGFAKKRRFQEDRKNCLSKIYRNWAKTLSKQEKYKEALEKYRKAKELNFQEDGIYTDMGFCYDKLGEQARAVEYYGEAINLNPGRRDIQCEAYYAWGRTLDDKGEHEEALQKFEEASKLESQMNEIKGKKVIKCSNRLCLVYYKLKRYGEALSLYEKLRDDNPRYAYVYIYIGLIYALIDYRQSKGEKYFDFSEKEMIKPEEDYLKLANQYFNKGISIYKCKENQGLNSDCVNAVEKEIERNEKLLSRNPQNNDESRVIIASMQNVLQKVSDGELLLEDSSNDKKT